MNVPLDPGSVPSRGPGDSREYYLDSSDNSLKLRVVALGSGDRALRELFWSCTPRALGSISTADRQALRERAAVVSRSSSYSSEIKKVAACVLSMIDGLENSGEVFTEIEIDPISTGVAKVRVSGGDREQKLHEFLLHCNIDTCAALLEPELLLVRNRLLEIIAQGGNAVVHEWATERLEIVQAALELSLVKPSMSPQQKKSVLTLVGFLTASFPTEGVLDLVKRYRNLPPELLLERLRFLNELPKEMKTAANLVYLKTMLFSSFKGEAVTSAAGKYYMGLVSAILGDESKSLEDKLKALAVLNALQESDEFGPLKEQSIDVNFLFLLADTQRVDGDSLRSLGELTFDGELVMGLSARYENLKDDDVSRVVAAYQEVFSKIASPSGRLNFFMQLFDGWDRKDSPSFGSTLVRLEEKLGKERAYDLISSLSGYPAEMAQTLMNTFIANKDDYSEEEWQALVKLLNLPEMDIPLAIRGYQQKVVTLLTDATYGKNDKIMLLSFIRAVAKKVEWQLKLPKMDFQSLLFFAKVVFISRKNQGEELTTADLVSFRLDFNEAKILKNKFNAESQKSILAFLAKWESELQNIEDSSLLLRIARALVGLPDERQAVVMQRIQEFCKNRVLTQNDFKALKSFFLEEDDSKYEKLLGLALYSRNQSPKTFVNLRTWYLSQDDRLFEIAKENSKIIGLVSKYSKPELAKVLDRLFKLAPGPRMYFVQNQSSLGWLMGLDEGQVNRFAKNTNSFKSLEFIKEDEAAMLIEDSHFTEEEALVRKFRKLALGPSSAMSFFAYLKQIESREEVHRILDQITANRELFGDIKNLTDIDARILAKPSKLTEDKELIEKFKSLNLSFSLKMDLFVVLHDIQSTAEAHSIIDGLIGYNDSPDLQVDLAFTLKNMPAEGRSTFLQQFNRFAYPMEGKTAEEQEVLLTQNKALIRVLNICRVYPSTEAESVAPLIKSWIDAQNGNINMSDVDEFTLALLDLAPDKREECFHKLLPHLKNDAVGRILVHFLPLEFSAEHLDLVKNLAEAENPLAYIHSNTVLKNAAEDKIKRIEKNPRLRRILQLPLSMWQQILGPGHPVLGKITQLRSIPITFVRHPLKIYEKQLGLPSQLPGYEPVFKNVQNQSVTLDVGALEQQYQEAMRGTATVDQLKKWQDSPPPTNRSTFIEEITSLKQRLKEIVDIDVANLIAILKGGASVEAKRQAALMQLPSELQLKLGVSLKEDMSDADYSELADKLERRQSDARDNLKLLNESEQKGAISFLKEALTVEGKDDDKASFSSIQVTTVLKNLSPRTSPPFKDGALLSEREEELLARFTTLLTCVGGKVDATDKMYTAAMQNPEAQSIGAKVSVATEDKVFSCVRSRYQAWLYPQLTEEGPFMRAATGQETIAQMSHQAIYARNVLSAHLGDTEWQGVQFDRFTGVLSQELVDHSHTSLLNLFQEHADLKKLTQAVAKDLNAQMSKGEEESAELYQAITAILTDRGMIDLAHPEKIWEYTENKEGDDIIQITPYGALLLLTKMHILKSKGATQAGGGGGRK